MLLVWGLFVICASASVSANPMVIKSGENLTIKCSTADCVKNLNNINGFYSGMFLCRDQTRVAYFDYDREKPDSGQFVAYSNDDDSRIIKTGFFSEHSITIINVTVHDSGFYRCILTYTIPTSPIFNSNTSCNTYRVDIEDIPVVTAADSEVSTSSPPVPELPRATLYLVIVITATVSILITLIFTLCFIPKIKQWSPSRGSRGARERSPDYIYEVMTTNGFRPVTVSPP